MMLYPARNSHSNLSRARPFKGIHRWWSSFGRSKHNWPCTTWILKWIMHTVRATYSHNLLNRLIQNYKPQWLRTELCIHLDDTHLVWSSFIKDWLSRYLDGSYSDLWPTALFRGDDYKRVEVDRVRSRPPVNRTLMGALTKACGRRTRWVYKLLKGINGGSTTPWLPHSVFDLFNVGCVPFWFSNISFPDWKSRLCRQWIQRASLQWSIGVDQLLCQHSTTMQRWVKDDISDQWVFLQFRC